MTDNTQPKALRLAELLTADEWPGNMTLVSYARECVAELRRQHARIAELESQLESIGAGGVSGPLIGQAQAAVASPLTKLQRKAIAVCFTSDKVSVSEVQRQLSISYADAQTLCQSIVDLGLTDELELAPSLKRGAPGGTQYVVRRSGFAKPSTLHHSCHVVLIQDDPS